MVKPPLPTRRDRVRTAALLTLAGAAIATALAMDLPSTPEPPDRTPAAVQPSR